MSEAAGPRLNDPKTVRAWYMFDWANSVYSLVIVTVIFPIYFNSVAVYNGSDMIPFLGFTVQNTVLYSYALSFSFLLVAVILPLLSGIADYTGDKKFFMRIFVVVGSISCMTLYFFNSFELLWLGILCLVLASVGYSGSLVFYDAYLPEIVTEDRYDQTSAKGFSMGYYGSVLMMVICLVIVMNPGWVGFSGDDAVGLATRVTFILVGVWWLGFSIIPFRYLPDNPYNQKPTGQIWSKGYREIKVVWQSLKHQSDLKRYLLAFFFYNMGVQTVMYLATLFGETELRLETDALIQILIIIQLVGALGAWLFSRVSRLKGNRFSLIVMICIWIGVCVAAYFITTVEQFFAVAAVVGLIMGGIQSLSRATYSKLIPPDTADHASYFSFYDVTYNLSIVVGTFSYGLINQITGTMRNSALVLALYFVIGLALLIAVRSPQIMRRKRIEEEVLSTSDV